MAFFDKASRLAGMAPALRENDDQVALAKRLAQQVINPQVQTAGSIVQQGNLAASNNNAAYQALAQIRREAQGATQDAYQKAAGATSVFSKGYSDAMQASVNGDATDINQFLQKLGAPQGQMLNTNGAAGDVVYGMTGAIPATALASQGAAAGAYAAQQPGNAIAEGLASSRLLMGDANSRYAEAIRKINESAPGIQQQALEDVRKGSADKKKAALDEWKAVQSAKVNEAKVLLAERKAKLDERIDLWNASGVDPVTGKKSFAAIKMAQQSLDKANAINAQNERTILTTNAANARAQASINASFARLDKELAFRERESAADGALDLAKADRDMYAELGVVAQLKKVKGGWQAVPVTDAKGKVALTAKARKEQERFSPTQLEEYKGKAYSGALAAYRGVPATDETEEAPPLLYADAIREGRAAGIPIDILMDALNEVYPVGVQGRPGMPKGAKEAIDKAKRDWATTGPRVEVPAAAPPFARSLLAEADQWLGTPYSWGGGGPGGPSYGIEQGKSTKGFDCSAFAQYLYAKQGIAIPRTTYEQWKIGTPVNREVLVPGDLVFFRMGKRGPEHIGIYTGDNKFIHAPKTGDVVKVSELSGYYADNFVGGRRING